MNGILCTKLAQHVLQESRHRTSHRGQRSVNREAGQWLAGSKLRPRRVDHTGRDLFEFQHVGKQEQNFLTNHSLAKTHGKLKTANLRFGGCKFTFASKSVSGREPGDCALLSWRERQLGRRKRLRLYQNAFNKSTNDARGTAQSGSVRTLMRLSRPRTR